MALAFRMRGLAPAWRCRAAPLARSTACAGARIQMAAYASQPKQHAEDGNHQGQNLVDFGYRKVAEEDKARMVGEVFHNVADKYDLMNDLMSGGIHRVWKDYFVSKLAPTPGTRILDVAGGTGDIAFRMVEYMQAQRARGWGSELARPSVTVFDINTSMLGVGMERAKQRGLQEDLLAWVPGDAEKLSFEDNSFDAYTIAFGIRNVTHIEAALKEAHRVLKPGGRFMCLEFSHVQNPAVSKVYDLFSFEVIPVIGQLVANDSASYKYLVESIRKFPDQETFADMIRDAGFSGVAYEDLTFGVSAVHSGFKM